ncbi:MAG: hypothetical protein U1F53_02550 [Burkholderiaceae bacterium]
MSKHQVFLVHGMGDFELGWSEAVRGRIVEAFNNYPKLRDNGFADAFEFKEITYNPVFEGWRDQWRADAEAAAGALAATGLSSKAADTLIKGAASPAGSSFWQTHVLDVVGFRFLMPIAQTVYRSVQSQILGHLKSFPPDDVPPYSVIAHSLGTAVAYETFHAMLTNGADGQSAPLGTAFRPNNMFMVANTAKLLWNRGGSAYPAMMGPNLANGDGLSFYFASFRHALDPVPNVDRFDPPASWFAPTAPKDAVYADVVLPEGDLQQLNVHSFEHYLSHPMVHVPILRQLVGFDSVVSDAEMKAQLKLWREASLANQALAEAKSQLKDLLLARATEGWAKEIDMLLALRALVLASKVKDGES